MQSLRGHTNSCQNVASWRNLLLTCLPINTQRIDELVGVKKKKLERMEGDEW